jgi:hypothetical protein
LNYLLLSFYYEFLPLDAKSSIFIAALILMAAGSAEDEPAQFLISYVRRGRELRSGRPEIRIRAD